MYRLLLFSFLVYVSEGFAHKGTETFANLAWIIRLTYFSSGECLSIHILSIRFKFWLWLGLSDILMLGTLSSTWVCSMAHKNATDQLILAGCKSTSFPTPWSTCTKMEELLTSDKYGYSNQPQEGIKMEQVGVWDIFYTRLILAGG